MQIDTLVKSPGCWLSMQEDTGIVISSRVRLARNIREAAFPGWAGESERVRLCNELRSLFERTETMAGSLFLDMAKLTALDKEILKERHLISNEMAEKGAGSGLIVSENENIAVMINEEDHLRLQAITPGLQLEQIWRTLNNLDSQIEQQLSFAFSHRLGYLTACPSNVGTGLRASVMVHLSGLKLMGELQAVINGLEKIGLAVRGLLGEGTEASGNMFQISNQSTLGQPEETIVKQLIRVVKDVVNHENNARARLFQQKRTFLVDQIGRAIGIAMHARILSSREAIDLLSALRLGVASGFVTHLKMRQINEIMLLTQPGHLQKMCNRILGPEERDQMRAGLLRDRLKQVALKE